MSPLLTDFIPPPRTKVVWTGLYVNIVYRNLMSENFQDFAQKLQRHCRFLNSASGLFRSGSGLKLQFVWTLYFFLAVSLLVLEIKDFLEIPECSSRPPKGTLAWDGWMTSSFRCRIKNNDFEFFFFKTKFAKMMKVSFNLDFLWVHEYFPWGGNSFYPTKLEILSL